MDDLNLSEWLHILTRWIHIFAGILWIGSTWYFTWLDRTMEHEKGQVWMVHSGGFYEVNKQQKPAAGRHLYWFKWEAAFTWLTGITLLVLVYYLGGLMVSAEVREMSDGAAAAISLGVLVGAWFLYDLLWLSPLGRNEWAGAAISYVLAVAATYALHLVFAPRAAYMQMGALFGTLMAANVWVRIIPAQRAMVAAASSGGEPDAALAARAKGRSRHNTFMVIPVIFTMIGSHFPVTTYGHDYNWIVLSVLIGLGWIVAGLIRGRV